jgi:ribokinase
VAPTEAAIAVVGSLNLDLVVRVPRLPGPGETVSGDDVFRNPGGKWANQAVAAAAVTLLQLEVPLETVAAAARTAEGKVVLNPAPVRALPSALLGEVDVLVPNRVELAQLAAGRVPVTVEEAAELAGRLPARAVVVTLGADGALVVEHGRARHVPAVPVRPVDTTAAGDAFCGGLADALTAGATLEAAARRAVRVAAAACLRQGAQASLPAPADLRALPR